MHYLDKRQLWDFLMLSLVNFQSQVIPSRVSDTHLLRLGQNAMTATQSGLGFSRVTVMFGVLVGQTMSTSFSQILIPGIAIEL